MESGDVILSFDGEDVADTRELVRRVGNAEVGKTVDVVVFRDGETETLAVTLGRREEAEGAIPAAAPRPDEPIEFDDPGPERLVDDRRAARAAGAWPRTSTAWS